MAPKHRSPNQPNRFVRFVKTPKGFVLVLLVILGIIGLNLAKPDWKAFETLVLAVATGFVLDLIVGFTYKKKRWFSDGGIVTGLIVGLVLSSFTPWYYTIATTAIAIASKHILKVGRKPIFNPAGVGLLVALFAFNSIQSWWGSLALLPSWTVVLLVASGLWVAQRVKKLPQVIAYIVTYFAVCGIGALMHISLASYSFLPPFVNSALFMAFFMLTDPPTSPSKRGDQIWFGAVAAGISLILYFTIGGLAYLLYGMLAVNLLKFVKGLVTSRAAAKAKAQAQAKLGAASRSRSASSSSAQFD